MKGLITVATFTVKDMIKRKSFIISNLIILILIVIGFNVPNILNAISKEDVEEGAKLLIVDSSNIFGESLSNLNSMELGYEFDIYKYANI